MLRDNDTKQTQPQPNSTNQFMTDVNVTVNELIINLTFAVHTFDFLTLMSLHLNLKLTKL